MIFGAIGQKKGMTRRFTETGDAIPVTVIEVLPNIITQIKSEDTDGYIALQVTTGERRLNRVTKAELGHYKKAQVTAGRGLWEFRLDKKQSKYEKKHDMKVGDALTVSQFVVGQIVDVTGTSKGRGFAGVVKRWNFRTQDATHGNSLSHRVPGSTGQNQSPGRTFRGKKMPGHYGNATATSQSLEVIHIDTERNLLLVKGAVPGPQGGDVIVRQGLKQKSVKEK